MAPEAPAPGSATRPRSGSSGASSRTTLARLEALAGSRPSGSTTTSRSTRCAGLQYRLHTRERARARALAARRRRAAPTPSSPRRSPARATRPATSSRRSTSAGADGAEHARARVARRALPRAARAPAPRPAPRRPQRARARSDAAQLAAPLAGARRSTVAGAAAFAVGATAGPLAALGRRDARGLRSSLACIAPLAACGASRASDSSRPSSSRLSKSPGETFEPVTASRIGANAWRGFWPSRSASARSASSIRGGLPRLDRAERLGGGAARRRVGAVRR